MAELKRKMDARPRASSRTPRVDVGAQTVELHRKNWLLLGAGLACIVIGFFALSMHDITLAPILLVTGYLVLIPWGLVARPKDVATSSPDENAKP